MPRFYQVWEDKKPKCPFCKSKKMKKRYAQDCQEVARINDEPVTIEFAIPIYDCKKCGKSSIDNRADLMQHEAQLWLKELRKPGDFIIQ